MTVFLTLPLLAFSIPAHAPRTVPGEAVVAEVDAAIEQATRRLVELQENLTDSEGEPREWPYEGVYRERGEIPPGYRVGGTSIAAWALIEAPGYAEDDERRAAVERGLAFVLESLEDEERLASGFSRSYDVRGWAHAYALEFLLRMQEHELVPEQEAERVAAMSATLVKWLEETAIEGTGGWNYARSNRGGTIGASPFMTAPTVLALERARRLGIEVDQEVLDDARAALRKGLQEGEVVGYSTARGGGDTQAGSVGRLPVTCLALLEEGGPERNELIARSIEAFLEHWGELEKRRRQTGTHKPPHGIAPYYFFYAHLYAAFAIEELPEARRRELRARFLERLFEVREESGGWNDRVFERSENFGTATSLLALLAPDLDRVP